MSHNLGPIVVDGRTITHTSGLDLSPSAGPLGGPRFAFLRFEAVNLNGNAKLTVDLGYGSDVFTKDSGTDFWTRPANTRASDFVTARPIAIRITGGTGTARLKHYGVGQPTDAGTPGDPGRGGID